MRTVPAFIPRPEYVGRQAPARFTGSEVKDAETIERMRVAGRLAARAMGEVAKYIEPGVTTDELDRIGHEYLCDHGAYPSTLGYRGFPKSLCTSVNEVVCHGIPDSTVLRDGDIVNIDITAFIGVSIVRTAVAMSPRVGAGTFTSTSGTSSPAATRRAAARSRDDAVRAVAICEAAGRALVGFENPEAADDALTAAVELHAAARLGQPSAALTLEWAHVAARRGRVRMARDRYDDALARAQAEAQPHLVAEAALGWAGVWVGDYLTDTDRMRMLALYETALDGLRDDTHASDLLRCRLRTRLAAAARSCDGYIADSRGVPIGVSVRRGSAVDDGM